MTHNRTPRIIILSTLLALMLMTLLAFTASAHTAAPTSASPLSVSQSVGNTPNSVPGSFIVGLPAHYKPGTIYAHVGSPSFGIANDTGVKQYVLYHGSILAAIGPGRVKYFNVSATGVYKLGLASNSSAHLYVVVS